MQQNPLQLFLSILAAREEVIFMIRVIGHQMHEDNRTKIGILRELSDEIYRGEQKRENFENHLYKHLGEGFRKLFLPKIIQKYNQEKESSFLDVFKHCISKIKKELNSIIHKDNSILFSEDISTLYIFICQIYFPKQGQQLCQDIVNQPNLRTTIQQIIHEPLVGILKFIINFQRQKLKQELSHLLNYEQEDRCNRNEKFYSEPLILGVHGLRYLNDLHNKYCYTVSRHSNRNVYDVLSIDDNTKILYLQGGGFISLISSITRLKDKSADNTQSVYIPVESTVEIITQRYEKMIKELMDQNSHVQKSVNRYYEQHKRYRIKPLPIKGYFTPKTKVQEIKSQRNNQKRTIESGPILSDMGRYSEPLNSISSLRLKQQKYRTQKQSDIILSGFISPKYNAIRKNKSVKNYETALLKSSAFQLFSDFPLRINTSKKRKQN